MVLYLPFVIQEKPQCSGKLFYSIHFGVSQGVQVGAKNLIYRSLSSWDSVISRGVWATSPNWTFSMSLSLSGRDSPPALSRIEVAKKKEKKRLLRRLSTVIKV